MLSLQRIELLAGEHANDAVREACRERRQACGEDFPDHGAGHVWVARARNTSASALATLERDGRVFTL